MATMRDTDDPKDTSHTSGFRTPRPSSRPDPDLPIRQPTCSNCRGPRRHGRRECAACTMYRRRHEGEPRPEYLIHRDRVRRAGQKYRAVPVKKLNTVYIMRDRDGGVLYIGATAGVSIRPGQHITARMAWWTNISSIELVHCADEEKARKKMDELIEEFNPVHNPRKR